MPARVTAIPKPFRIEIRSLKNRAPAPTEKIGTDHRADGRRAGLFYAVGLAEEVDKWLKESEQQKFPDIFAGYQAEVLCEDVEEKKYDSGDKNP